MSNKNIAADKCDSINKRDLNICFCLYCFKINGLRILS